MSKKVSEKSLELNIGSELLNVMRWRWRMPKAYLRGLTQGEEHREGVDFFAELPSSTRVLAFQFKAPKGQREKDATPYRFRIQRNQHDKLSVLASGSPQGVYYVLPFYITPTKLQRDVPCLLRDTWLLRVADMVETDVFGPYQTKTVSCWRSVASINPHYELRNALRMELRSEAGIPVGRFGEWYRELQDSIDQPVSDSLVYERRLANPWLVRGLRVAIVQT